MFKFYDLLPRLGPGGGLGPGSGPGRARGSGSISVDRGSHGIDLNGTARLRRDSNGSPRITDVSDAALQGRGSPASTRRVMYIVTADAYKRCGE